MVQKQTRESGRRPRRASQRETSPGDNIRDRIAGLRSLPREQMADAVFMLTMGAKRRSTLLREAINQRADIEADPSPAADADLATYLAVEAASTLRHHAASAPSFLDALLQRSASQRAAEAIAANPQKSDRAIAAEIRVGSNTVRRARWATAPPGTVEPRIGKRREATQDAAGQAGEG